MVNERFYDTDLGGARRSLVAAKEFRDRIVEWEPLLLQRGYRHQLHQSRRGYHYSEYWHGDRLRRYWVAGWQDDGRRRVRRFEITAGCPFSMARAATVARITVRS